MQRRSSGIYEFRKRLSTELAGRPASDHGRAAFPQLVNPKTRQFKGEIVRSLGTSDFREAKRRDLQEVRKVLDAFDAAVKALTRQTPSENVVQPATLLSPGAADLAGIEAETLAGLLS